MKFAKRANEMFIKQKEKLMDDEMANEESTLNTEEDGNRLPTSFRNSFIISFYNMGVEY